MNRRVLMVVVGFLAIGAASVILQAQRFGRFFIRQNEPARTEFIFARWHYGSNYFLGGDGWSHDYPVAEEHINQIMSEATGLNVERMSYRIVELGSPEIFQYPFSYISEAGEMRLTEQEVVNLREYINRGGFIMVDDFDGANQLENLRRNLLRVFPEREMFPLTIEHPIFNTFYSLDPTNLPAPYNFGHNPMFYGYPDGRGNTAMIICHDNDIGDFWEWIDQPRFPLEPSSESLRFGINFVVYAMTH
jgi:hypothetical protein